MILSTEMVTVKNIGAVIGLCVMFTASSVEAREFSQSWQGSKFAPCEGIGLLGAYRVHVRGDVEGKADGSKVITNLSLYATSATFTQNEGSVTGSAVVRAGAQIVERIVLARPSVTSIEPSPKPEETRRMYFPEKTKALTVQKNGELWIEAFVAVKTSQGACALGGTSQKVELP
jgi:hypothetical protein